MDILVTTAGPGKEAGPQEPHTCRVAQVHTAMQAAATAAVVTIWGCLKVYRSGVFTSLNHMHTQPTCHATDCTWQVQSQQQHSEPTAAVHSSCPHTGVCAATHPQCSRARTELWSLLLLLPGHQRPPYPHTRSCPSCRCCGVPNICFSTAQYEQPGTPLAECRCQQLDLRPSGYCTDLLGQAPLVTCGCLLLAWRCMSRPLQQGRAPGLQSDHQIEPPQEPMCRCCCGCCCRLTLLRPAAAAAAAGAADA